MKLTRLTAALILGLTTQITQASGFALIEQSASGQGLSYAGAAANTEDASVMWFNPAGLTAINGNQVVAGLHLIAPKTEFTDTGSTAIGGSKSVDGGVNGLVPNLYWKGNYDDYAFGLALNAPFGSKIEYSADWIGRTQAIKTDLKTYNLNLNIAKELSDRVSFGVGVNAQRVDLDMTQASGVGAGAPLAVVKADSWGFGYNLGLMVELSDSTDLGVSYRSEVNYAAKGTFEVTGLTQYDVKADVTLPATAMLSLSHSLNDKTMVLADATWTGWKAYDELVIRKSSDGSVVTETNQNFTDSMRYSLGVMHQLDGKWRLRTGIARDFTPVPDAESLSPRTPDTDRTWMSAGFNYQISKSMSMDFGYTKIFGDDAKINRTAGTLLKGDYKASVDIFSAQLVWNY